MENLNISSGIFGFKMRISFSFSLSGGGGGCSGDGGGFTAGFGLIIGAGFLGGAFGGTGGGATGGTSGGGLMKIPLSLDTRRLNISGVACGYLYDIIVAVADFIITIIICGVYNKVFTCYCCFFCQVTENKAV